MGNYANNWSIHYYPYFKSRTCGRRTKTINIFFQIDWYSSIWLICTEYYYFFSVENLGKKILVY